jgi:hypothetical protein
MNRFAPARFMMLAPLKGSASQVSSSNFYFLALATFAFKRDSVVRFRSHFRKISER